ncbi:MAG: ThuA domain-containing protein [Planctomycetota bacterium]
MFVLLVMPAAAAVHAAEGGPAAAVLIVVGPSDHPAGTHEPAAGARLLAAAVAASEATDLDAAVSEGWPSAERLAAARTVVFLGDRFPANRLPDAAGNMAALAAAADRGCGIVCLHYATAVGAEDIGPDGDHPLLRWTGGYFAYRSCPHHTSVAKVFDATITPTAAMAAHPLGRGWETFSLREEPYTNNYFGPTTGRLPGFAAVATTEWPAESSRVETVAWARERPEGGRGFAVVMPHFYRSWADEDLRTLILNGVVWSAGGEVPAEGVGSPRPDLAAYGAGSIEPQRRRRAGTAGTATGRP